VSIVRTTLEIELALADRFFGFYLHDFVAVALERDEKSRQRERRDGWKSCLTTRFNENALCRSGEVPLIDKRAGPTEWNQLPGVSFLLL